MFIMLRKRSFWRSSLSLLSSPTTTTATTTNRYCGCSRLMSATATAPSAAAAPSSSSSFPVGQRDPSSYVRRLPSSSSSSAISLYSSKNGANFNFMKRPLLKLRSCFPSNVNLNNCSSISNSNGINDDNNGGSYVVNGNGRQKARPFAPSLPQVQLLHASEEDDLSRVLNRGGSVSQRGSSVGFLGKNGVKIVVAVDVDEVLGNFVSALNQFIAARYSSNHCVSEYHVYEFCKIWKCTRDEADIRVHEFFKTSYFKAGIHPIPGAREALHKLSRFCSLSIVTSRQNVIKDHTIKWIEKHYPGLFEEIHFGNHFALDGKSRPKSEICRSLGAQVLIDDNPKYAIECAEVGIRVLLFDYENSYPWSKMESVDQHPLVTKVHNWKEVEHQMALWVIS